MSDLVSPRRRRYRLSTRKLREEAVSLVKGAMETQGFSRTRAATIVADSLGFSRSAVVGWCEAAGVLASPESTLEREQALEMALAEKIGRRLAAGRLADED